MTNISDVIAWKFNNQPGMRCIQDESGVIRIVEFPGGVPSQADQDSWRAEYEAYVSSSNKTSDEATNRIDRDKILRTLFEVNFSLENRVRALSGQPSIDRQTYRSAWVNIYKSLT